MSQHALALHLLMSHALKPCSLVLPLNCMLPPCRAYPIKCYVTPYAACHAGTSGGKSETLVQSIPPQGIMYGHQLIPCQTVHHCLQTKATVLCGMYNASLIVKSHTIQYKQAWVDKRVKRHFCTSQGCRKLFRAGGANHTKRASRALEANRGQQGQITGSGGESCKKGILPCSAIIIFC